VITDNNGGIVNDFIGYKERKIIKRKRSIKLLYFMLQKLNLSKTFKYYLFNSKVARKRNLHSSFFLLL